jgi:DNA-binding response OmpR family regulator
MRRITLGNLDVDRDRYDVRIDGVRVDLTFIEFELLSYLARRPGRVLHQDELSEALWGEPAAGSAGKLRVHMSRLRKKISASRPWTIRTVPKRGYALIDAGEAGEHAGERPNVLRAEPAGGG